MRLHFADLAVNKVLAAASRRQPRDIVDLYLVRHFIMPLWHAVWAAPGKDSEMTPEKAIERIRYHSQYAPGELANSVFAAESAAVPNYFGCPLCLDDAESIIKRLPVDTVGKLLVDPEGRCLRSFAEVKLGRRRNVRLQQPLAEPSRPVPTSIIA